MSQTAHIRMPKKRRETARPATWRTRPRIRNLAITSLAVVATAAAAAPAAEAGTHYRGQWQCVDRGVVMPLAGARVQLMGTRGGPAFAYEVRRAFTDAAGRFDLEVPNLLFRDEYLVRVSLRDSDDVNLNQFATFGDWKSDTVARPDGGASVNLGGQLLFGTGGTSPMCAIWRGVHNAAVGYRAIAGERHPAQNLSVLADAPYTAGVPWSAPATIPWAIGFPASDASGAHEFAHTMRYAFDGGAIRALNHAEYLRDAGRFLYPQHHDACSRVNPGFAFNEGWSWYWSRQITASPGCAGVSPTDMSVEGNVAAALADLEARCATRRQMIDVLRRNPFTVHSFDDFERALRGGGMTCARSGATPPAVSTPTGPTPDEAARRARVRAAELARQLSILRRQLTGALSAAARAALCPVRPCHPLIRRLTRPPLLHAEIEVTRLTRRAVMTGGSVKELDRVARLGPVKAEREFKADALRMRRSVVRITLKALRDVQRVTAPVRKIDHSAATRRFFVQLGGRIKQLERLGDKGALPSFVVVPRERDALPKRVAVIGFAPIAVPPAPVPVADPISVPAPLPTPTPVPPTAVPADTRPASSLKLACPTTIDAGKEMTVAGSLSTVRKGDELTLTYEGVGTTVTHTSTTDAVGAYGDAFTPPVAGTLSVQAHWAGDSGYRPSDSAVCTVAVV